MLKKIAAQFFPGKEISSILPYGNGHINDTYKLDVPGDKVSYILQRINTDVFKNPQGIIETHFRLQDIFSSQAGSLSIPEIYPDATGNYLHIDDDGNAWRLTGFIEDSHSIEVVEEPWQALEAGNAYGWFALRCNVLDAATFPEPIKDFHRLSFRLRQLHDAINANKSDRLDAARPVVDFFLARETSLSLIETLVDKGEIPLRIVHNDTKINNLLFRGNKAVAVIDLDTTGPGILFYDYGDALRTSANTAEEDEKDLSKVAFNLEAFASFTKGYMNQVHSIVSQKEKELFYLAPVLLTYIIGIRFLADYLNGDVYYKTAYPEHNMDRCKVQKALIESMEARQDKIREIISSSLDNIDA